MEGNTIPPELRPIHDYEECRNFAEGFDHDPCFSDPMLMDEEQVRKNLMKSIEKPERHCVIGIFRGDKLVGLFAFLVLREEKYAEMLVGLSRDREAYREMFRYLEQNFPDFHIDFVFNPRNDLLRQLLEARGAGFEPEQQKMVLGTLVLDVDTTGIELFSELYAQQYFAIHNQDMYWTGEKVAAAPEKFRTLLAVENGRVVGYLDVTHCFAENEPYDLFVLPQYRHRGYGRKLLTKAIQMNQPKGMMLLVDVDDAAAIGLYESVGFVVAENQNSLTAHWTINSERM